MSIPQKRKVCGLVHLEEMEEPFSKKWPKTPIKALGVYFTYDTKLLKERNFIERLDSIKKLINIWIKGVSF